jgi:hypothetical protein
MYLRPSDRVAREFTIDFITHSSQLLIYYNPLRYHWTLIYDKVSGSILGTYFNITYVSQ